MWCTLSADKLDINLKLDFKYMTSMTLKSFEHKPEHRIDLKRGIVTLGK